MGIHDAELTPFGTPKELIATKEARQFALDLTDTEPDWDKIREKFTIESARGNITNYSQAGIMSWVSEAHIKHILSSRRALIPHFEVLANNDRPIITDNFNFVSQHGHLKVIFRRSGLDYSDIDALAMLGDSPAVVEIKLTTQKQKSRNNQRGGMGLLNAMIPENVLYFTRPIAEYFMTQRVGYILVGLPEMDIKSSEQYSEFERMNGIYTTIYADRSTFLDDISNNLNIANL